jgi:hypothetical protein
VKVESIKRQNKLYSTDSNNLFLRKSLTIPTTKDQVRQHLGSVTRQKREKQEQQEESLHLVMKETGASREVCNVLFANLQLRGSLILLKASERKY